MIELRKVISKQLQSERTSQLKTLRCDRERLERLSSQLHLTKQQISFFSEESTKAQASLKEAANSLRKEHCRELLRLKNPSSAVLEVIEKVLLVFDVKDRSWRSFKKLYKSAALFCQQVQLYSPEQLSEEQIAQLIPLWKHQQLIQSKLANKAACLLAAWAGGCAEFRLKKETLQASKKKIPDLEKKIEALIQTVAVNDEKCTQLESKIEEIKQQLRSADKFASEEVSALSAKSADRRLEVLENRTQFPNFSSKDLYGEYFHFKEDDSQPDIMYEGSMDTTGCCRSRFFCF